MKKIIFILCAIFALTCMTAFAETANVEEKIIDSKVVLWEHLLIIVDEDGTQTEQVVKVTFEPLTPVRLVKVDSGDADMFVAAVYLDGVAPAVIGISPANMGLHYNLNDYTDEQLQEYIESVAVGFEENYTSEVLKSEGGNTYVAVEDDYIRSISTIYEDFNMEIYQFGLDSDGNYNKLTDADKAFALAVFQGIWTE